MSIIYSPKSRRQFLVGSGQALLALPLLPSLIPQYAMAQATVVPRRMMNFAFDHHNESQFWPNPSIASTPVGAIGVRERLLSSMGTSSSTVISSLMSNPLYNTLLAQNQITLARGFQNHLSGGNGHVTRAFGGHTIHECGSSSEDPNHRSSFDYLVELSPTVYPNPSPSMTKVIRIDLDGCWTYVQRTGTLSVNPGAHGYGDVLKMYNAVFASLTNQSVSPGDLTNTRKTNILNRVFPAFQNYKTNRKISSEDRVRLDQHLAFLTDLQKSLSVVVQAPSLACTKPSTPVLTGATRMQINNLYVDLMVTAFKCGLTQFGSLNFEAQDPSWIPGYTSGAGFHGVMHGTLGIPAQNNGYESFHKFGYDLIADRFLAPLNIEEGSTGRTYVDNMITTALSHLGMQSGTALGNHGDGDVQHTIFGSMGSKLRAGRYYAMPTANGRLPNNTFIMTLLELMGVPASEYNKNSSVVGQGFGYYGSTSATYGSRFYTPIIEMLA